MNIFADYPATTPQLGLPMLFVGQAQKEFFVNQSLAMLDALWPRVVRGSLGAPPLDAGAGDCFRVLDPAQGEWAGHENALAVRVGEAWHFIAPVAGMRIYDQAEQRTLAFDTAWQSADLPATATGGATIDAEARALLAQVIDALAKLGLVARHSV